MKIEQAENGEAVWSMTAEELFNLLYEFIPKVPAERTWIGDMAAVTDFLEKKEEQAMG